MKKLLTIFLSIISLNLVAQVPQGVGYQGVATDANGIELVNQAISIRASVLSGSATGAVEWEETHATSTDTFGLFTLTIGQGTNTTNGTQTSFADISWGTNTHFLKIEMDVTGGTNYSFMGTNQMMSVPYALYAESANINYDSISNFLSNDSTFITNVGGGMGGGCDIQFPDGFDNMEAITIDLLALGSYNVPANRTLYITHAFCDDQGQVTQMTVDGLPVFAFADEFIRRVGPPYLVKSNSVISVDQLLSSPQIINGFLVDSKVQPLTIDFNNIGNSFQVPSDKILYINMANSSIANFLEFDGKAVIKIEQAYIGEGSNVPLLAKPGTIISAYSLPALCNISGYLADENYFAGCGGGSSSSVTSSLDSTAIANMIAGAGGGSGCDFQFPDGLHGEPITMQNLNSSTYTVPSGKNLYIVSIYNPHNGASEVRINNMTVQSGILNTNGYNQNSSILCLKDGDILSAGQDIVINGLLIDKIVEPITMEALNGNTYMVASGKRLYITSIYNPYTNAEVRINNMTIQSGSMNIGVAGGNNVYYENGGILFLKSGDVLSASQAGIVTNGYLVDENYFAGCGGGGSSSTSSTINYDSLANLISSDSTFITNVGGGMGGGGCDFKYPDGLDGDPVTIDNLDTSPYTVPSGKNLYIMQIIHHNQNSETSINGSVILQGRSNFETERTLSMPWILEDSDILSTNDNGIAINGFLIDQMVDPLSLTNLFTNQYTVPNNQNLYISQLYSNSSDELYINGKRIFQGEINRLQNMNLSHTNTTHFILKSGDILSANVDFFHVNGYLADENYFAGCGGGGSSSSNTGLDSATVSTMIANALTQQNSKDYDFIEANDSLYIPSGVFSIFIEAWGAGGGGVPWWQGCQLSGSGGGGGYVSASMQVQQNDLLFFEIGNPGGYGTTNNSHGQSTKIYLNGTLIIEAEGGHGASCGNSGSGGSGTIYNYNIINNEHIISGSGGTTCNQCNAEPGYSFNGILYNNNLNYGMGNCSGCGPNSKKGFVFIKY